MQQILYQALKQERNKEVVLDRKTQVFFVGKVDIIQVDARNDCGNDGFDRLIKERIFLHLCFDEA